MLSSGNFFKMEKTSWAILEKIQELRGIAQVQIMK